MLYPDVLTVPDAILLQFLHATGYWKNARFFSKTEHTAVGQWMSNDRELDDDTIYRVLMFGMPGGVYGRKRKNRVETKIIMPTDALVV